MKEPRKKYRAVIIDPPWSIEQKGAARGAVRHYNLMPLAQIKALPVADLMADNAHIWLWVTNAAIEHGYAMLRAWGFIPRSIFCWIKPRMGLGTYIRNASEHVLFGTRGKAPILFHAQPNWLFAPVQDHSHKPEEFHKIVERCSPGPYLELFARRKTPGWDVWGNEIESDIDIPGYPVPNSPATRKFQLKGAVNE